MKAKSHAVEGHRILVHVRELLDRMVNKLGDQKVWFKCPSGTPAFDSIHRCYDPISPAGLPLVNKNLAEEIMILASSILKNQNS